MRRNQQAQAKTSVWRRRGRPRRGASSAAAAGSAGEGRGGRRRARRPRRGARCSRRRRRTQAPTAERVREMAAKALGLARAMGLRAGPARHRCRRRKPDGAGAARPLPHALGAGAPALDRVGGAGRPDLQPPVAAGRRAPRRRGPAGTPARRVDPQRRARHQRLDDRRDPARARHDRRVLRRRAAWTRFASSSATRRSRATSCSTRTNWPSGASRATAAATSRRRCGTSRRPARARGRRDHRRRDRLSAEPMPYELLWLVPASARTAFNPPYGRVVPMQPR